MKPEKFPHRGHFGWKTLLGAYEPDAEAMIDTSPIFGLDPEMTFAYGCLRTQAGDMYEMVRSIRARDREEPEFAVALSGFVAQTTAGHGDDCFHVMPLSAEAATSKHAVKELVENDTKAVWRSAENAPTPLGEPDGKAFAISCTGDTFSWTEEGVMEVTGKLIGPGLHWYLPEKDLGIYYVSLIFLCEGTVLGEPVRGIIALDQSYMQEGGIMYRRKCSLVGQEVHRLWYTWATVYKDGTIDAGHFQVGHGRSGFALLTDEKGEPYFSNHVDAEFQLREDADGRPWPEHIRLDVEGQAWEFVPDPKGTMPDLLTFIQSSTPQNEGRWRRVGDEREPDVWFAWGEIAPEHGLEYKPRFKGMK